MEPDDIFSRMFIPTEDGYIYYPSRRSGGKLVTEAEYRMLLDQWRRVAGQRGLFALTGLLLLAIFGGQFLTSVVSLPAWSRDAFNSTLVVGALLWFMYCIHAPRRLVAGRPDVRPPKTPTEVDREGKALRADFGWGMIFFMLAFMAATCAKSVANLDGSTISKLWLAGNLVAFGICFGAAVRKWLDRAGG